MEKALKILKELDDKDIWVLLELELEHTNISGAIAELQEAMKPKTCEGCKHKPNEGESYYDPCGTCARFFYDHYELKGNA